MSNCVIVLQWIYIECHASVCVSLQESCMILFLKLPLLYFSDYCLCSHAQMNYWAHRALLRLMLHSCGLVAYIKRDLFVQYRLINCVGLQYKLKTHGHSEVEKNDFKPQKQHHPRIKQLSINYKILRSLFILILKLCRSWWIKSTNKQPSVELA